MDRKDRIERAIKRLKQRAQSASAHPNRMGGATINFAQRTNMVAVHNAGRAGSSQAASATQTTRIQQNGAETREESSRATRDSGQV